MKTSHAGLRITEAEWDANMRHTEAALHTMRVAEPEKAEFLSLFTRYKHDIIDS